MPGLAAHVTGIAAAAALLGAAPGFTRDARGGPDHSVPRAAADTITRRYDIQLAYTGYTGLADSEDCRALVNRQGYDSLAGTVAGVESTGRSTEDVEYRGRLRRVVRMDYCLAIGGDGPGWCVATLTGAASMQVELTVYGEEDRGAWLQAEPDSLRPRPDSVHVRGNCSPAQMDEIRTDFPGGESAGTPDGQPVADLAPTRFVAGGIPRLRVGYFPPDPREGGWALRVLRGSP